MGGPEYESAGSLASSADADGERRINALIARRGDAVHGPPRAAPASTPHTDDMDRGYQLYVSSLPLNQHPELLRCHEAALAAQTARDTRQQQAYDTRFGALLATPGYPEHTDATVRADLHKQWYHVPTTYRDRMLPAGATPAEKRPGSEAHSQAVSWSDRGPRIEGVSTHCPVGSEYFRVTGELVDDEDYTQYGRYAREMYRANLPEEQLRADEPSLPHKRPSRYDDGQGPQSPYANVWVASGILGGPSTAPPIGDTWRHVPQDRSPVPLGHDYVLEAPWDPGMRVNPPHTDPSKLQRAVQNLFLPDDPAVPAKAGRPVDGKKRDRDKTRHTL